MRPITMLPSLPPPSSHLRGKKKSSGKTPRWQRAFITPFGAESSICIPRENATRRKKDADAICKTPTGVGRERAMVIEEARGRGERRQRGVKVGKANFVIACDSPEARSV